LSKYIIDNNSLKSENRKKAIEVLDFIEEFTPQLSTLNDTSFVPGLKQKISIKFKEAQAIIATADCPL
jgi:hypothetical protein